MDKIKTVKIKNEDGSISEESYNISVDAKNVDMDNNKDLQETIGNIDIDNDGNIAEQLKDLDNNINVLSLNIKKKAYFFNTVADMKATDLKLGEYACTLGYHEPNDGGEAEYRIVDGNHTDDGGTYHKLVNNLFAELILDKSKINPKTFGAYGDGIHDDYLPIQSAINRGNVILTPGTYYISKAINVGSNKIFDGNRATLKPANGKYGIEITGNGFSNVRVEIVLKNISFNLSLGAIGGIYMKDTYFVYIDDVNIANMINENAIGINIINGFNHVISNSRILGNTQSNNNNQIGINILTDSASAGLSNMTNNKYDTILIQNFKYAIKANWTVTTNMTIFENLGFSNNEYCYYLEGWADPVIINNSRMEVGSRFSTDGIELTGFYLGPSITACIDGLNAYNIQKVIESDSTKPLSIKGAISLTGALPSGRTNKYVLFSKISGAVYLFSNIYSFSTVYDITNTAGTT